MERGGWIEISQEGYYIKGDTPERQVSTTMSSSKEYNFINTPLLEEDTEMEVSSGQVDFAYQHEIDLSLIPLQV